MLPATSFRGHRPGVAITRRFPLSPVAGITPFNFPVLLAAHKNRACDGLRRDDHAEAAAADPLTTLRLGSSSRHAALRPARSTSFPVTSKSRRSSSKDPRVRVITFTAAPKPAGPFAPTPARNACLLELGGQTRR